MRELQRHVSLAAALAILTGAAACRPAVGAPSPVSSASPEQRRTPTPAVPTATSVAPEATELSRESIAATVVDSGAPTRLASLPSPDGRWSAEVFAYDCIEVMPDQRYARQELRLVEASSEASRIVDTQLIACGGLGAYGFGARFWSASSRYLYYTDAATGVPDGCGFWTPPLRRVDASDGKVEELGAGPVSPDGTLLAGWQGERLGIWRVDGEPIGLVDVPRVGRVPGPIAWRPDSTAVAFLITEGYCPLGETDLGRLDLQNMIPTIVLAYREASFADLVWDAPNRITLTDESGARWRYDFVTRDLSPAPP